jgi:1-acyl-sn-glycerol-3-phosphate acyltransferase
VKVPIFYSISRAICRVFFFMTGGVKCVGTENMPESGGVILAPNHISFVDPPAVGMGMKRQLLYMAKEELFKVPIFGWWMRGVQSFPVRRGTADRKAIKQAIDLLDQGGLICIFPEGKRSEDGKLQEPELGIGLIALKSRAPIVPAAIAGSDKVLAPHSTKVRRHPIHIVYGKPLTFPDLYESKESRAAIEEIGRRTMAAIAGLQAINSD